MMPGKQHGGQNAGKRYPPEILSRQEVNRLLRACSPTAPTGIRNRALITVLYRAGLRLNEALWLYPKDLDPGAGSIRVLFGKGTQGSGRRARTVAMDPMAFSVLELWMTRRAELLLLEEQRTGRAPEQARLFCTLTGEPVQGQYVRKLMKRLADRAGIVKRVHPHGLRHTCAAELAAEGVPVNMIQRQLGHLNLGTTSTYLDHIAPKALLEMGQQRTWNLED